MAGEVYALCRVTLRVKLSQPWGDDVTAAEFRKSSLRALKDELDRLLTAGRAQHIDCALESEILPTAVVQANPGGGS